MVSIITEEIYQQIRACVKTAGDRLTEATDIHTEEKTDFKNLVTQYDKNTQAYLMSVLGEILPEATFLCEEEDVADTSGAFVFVGDPIDGTTNFVKGYAMSAVSVALLYRGDLQLGMVYNPFTGEFFEARKDGGAFLNEKRIRATQEGMNTSLAGFGTSPYYSEYRDRTTQLVRRLMDCSVDIRRGGSAALDLCYVAAGRLCSFFECRLSPWDFAAGICIVQEAGGMVTDFQGSVPDCIRKSSIVAGGPKGYAQMMDIIGGK